MRGKSTFRQTDVRRALKAISDAGFEVGRVEIDATGKIIVIPGKPEHKQDPNEWDRP